MNKKTKMSKRSSKQNDSVSVNRVEKENSKNESMMTLSSEEDYLLTDDSSHDHLNETLEEFDDAALSLQDKDLSVKRSNDTSLEMQNINKAAVVNNRDCSVNSVGGAQEVTSFHYSPNEVFENLIDRDPTT